MYSYILLIFLNILFINYLNKKNNTDNLYTKEKNRFYKIKIKLLASIINVFNIILGFLSYTVLLLNKDKISIIDLILFITSILLYILIEFNKIKDKRFKLIDKKLFELKDILYVIIPMVILLSGRIPYLNDQYDIVIYILMSLFILIGFYPVLSLLLANRRYLCYTASIEDYFKDIKFYKKIQLSNFINYLIYISAFIMFVFIRIPYIYLFYILLALILFLVIKKKAKKISIISDKIYKSITLAHEYPGVIFAFDYTKDLFFLKKLTLILIYFVISLLSCYMVGESAFIFVSIIQYFLLLYVVIEDKIYLIRYIESLNEKLIDKKIYSIKVNKKVSYVDTIKIFNINIYRLIIEDNIIYKSNLILFDPELLEKEIDIYINKSNLDDYIIIDTMLYEE